VLVKGDGENVRHRDSPFWVGQDIVHLLVAELAKVVVGTLCLIHDADTATVLPDVTFVALDEQAASIFGLRGVGYGREVVGQRWTRVVLHTADAAGDLIITVGIAIGIDVCFIVLTLLIDVVGVCVLSSSGSTGLTRLFGRVESAGAWMHSVVGEVCGRGRLLAG
jgi:hypothetical protein